jgi:hypothetical protein
MAKDDIFDSFFLHEVFQAHEEAAIKEGVDLLCAMPEPDRERTVGLLFWVAACDNVPLEISALIDRDWAAKLIGEYALRKKRMEQPEMPL